MATDPTNFSTSKSSSDELDPIGAADPTKLRNWVDESLLYGHQLHTRRFSMYRRAELMDQGCQWLRKAMSGFDNGGYSQWSEANYNPEDPLSLPMPVFNEGVGARMNESTRLSRPDYQPIIKARGQNPDLMVRTQVRNSRRALLHRLREMEWHKQKDLMCLHIPTYGGSWVRSEWVSRYDKTSLVPGPAGQCLACGGKSFSKQPIKPKPGESQWGPKPAPISACPDCGGKLLPKMISMEEAQGKDSLGMPLGVPEPLGDWECEIPSPYDMFPRNLGVDISPGSLLMDVTEARVVNMDYLFLRWPDKASEVQPENPATLAKYHPVVGALGIYQSMTGTKFFSEAVRLKVRHRRPWIPKGENTPNQGRSVYMAGNVVLADLPYMIPSSNYPGESVERCVYEYIPWEYRDGGRTLQGLGLWEIMFDPQEAGNEIRSQRAAVRQRLALPIYLFSKAMNVEIQSMIGGIPGSIAYFDPDPNLPNPIPQLFNNQTIDAGVNVELQDAIDSIARYAFHTAETGTAIPGVDTAAEAKQLKESAGELREARIRRIKNGVTTVFEHGAKLMSHLYIEPRPVAYIDEAGQDTWDHIDGKALAHNPIVEVEPADSDENEQKGLVIALSGQQLIVPANETLRVKKKLASVLAGPSQQGLIDELFQDQNLQESSAQREWIYYRDAQTIPMVDPSLDDHQIHYDEHGRSCFTDWFRDLEQQAGWDGALRVLAGQWDQLRQSAIQQQVMAALMCEQAMAMGQPSMPPPTLQEAILTVWLKAIESATMAGKFQPDTDPKMLLQVLQWRSHMESHKMVGEAIQMLAQMRMTLPAPGSATTNTGNQVTPGQDPEQMPGQAAVAQAAAQAPAQAEQV